MAPEKVSPKSVIAKSDDGSIQITFTIPFAQIEKEKEKARLLRSRLLFLFSFYRTCGGNVIIFLVFYFYHCIPFL